MIELSGYEELKPVRLLTVTCKDENLYAKIAYVVKEYLADNKTVNLVEDINIYDDRRMIVESKEKIYQELFMIEASPLEKIDGIRKKED